MSQYQDLHVLRGTAARKQRQPAEQPDNKQIGEAEEHDRRGQKPKSDALHEFWHAARDGHPRDIACNRGTMTGAGVIDAIVKLSTWACWSGDSESSAEKLLKHGG
jgi:hypothetical protein